VLVENSLVFIVLPLHNNGPAFWKSDDSSNLFISREKEINAIEFL